MESTRKTLAYFDSANYPLTREELYAFLWRPPFMGYAQFLEFLSDPSPTRGGAGGGVCGFQTKFGYYFLPGKEETVEERRRKLLRSEEKLRIARRAAKKIRSIPFLRAVFVCNSVGMEQASANSDIDFFIVAAPRRVWLVRLFTNIILRFWGLRVHKKIKDRVCLSFYVDSEHLNLETFKIADDDIHFAYWLAQMLPLYDPENYHAKFLEANKWVKKFIPNSADSSVATYHWRVADGRLGSLWKKAWEKMWTGGYGDLLEKQAKGLQWARLKFSIKEKARQGGKDVVISDGVLKFHENDTRAAYREEWLKKCNN